MYNLKSYIDDRTTGFVPDRWLLRINGLYTRSCITFKALDEADLDEICYRFINRKIKKVSPMKKLHKFGGLLVIIDKSSCSYTFLNVLLNINITDKRIRLCLNRGCN